MKNYTDLEQSKKLAELLPIDSADAHYWCKDGNDLRLGGGFSIDKELDIPAWSIGALLDYIKDKCGYYELVYLSNTSNNHGNRLTDVHRLSTDVYDIYEKEIIDAAFKMIIKLNS